ncbi:hypothetical protein Q5752_005382 [Cryptotrichosporon argae]
MFRLRSAAGPSTKGKDKDLSRQSGRRGSSRAVGGSSSQLTLDIHVPNYGAILLPAPQLSDPGPHDAAEPDGPTQPQAADDHLLVGELQVGVPPGTGRVRVRAIRVEIRSRLRVDMGRKGLQEDELFRRKVEMEGEDGTGIWLDEGSQRFAFTLVLPSTLAAHDWHVNASLSHDLIATLDGLPVPSLPSARAHSPGPSSIFGFRARPSAAGAGAGTGAGAGVGARSRSASRHASPAGSRSASPAPHLPLPSPGLPSFGPDGAILDAAQNGVGTSAHPPVLVPATRARAPPLPSTPSYDESQALHAGGSGSGGAGTGKGNGKSADAPTSTDRDGAEPPADSWLHGTVEKRRTLMFMYNPNPADTVTALAERYTGLAPGLGPWEIQLVSDVWTVGALLSARFTLPSPDPALTLFAFRVSLQMTHAVRSPRDDAATPALTTTRTWPVVEAGRRPAAALVHPDKHVPAVYRSQMAGGTDVGEVRVEKKGRLPDDHVLRPSTVAGVVTPIKVTHAFVIDAYFSVHGEDEQGQPMRAPGPGGLRMLRLTQPVVVPSCAFVPQYFDLPSYGDLSSAPASAPCALCGTPAAARLCTACPRAALPHARHDHAPALVGTGTGVCPVCAESVTPAGAPGWQTCACGMDVADMEARMRAATIEESGAGAGAHGEIAAELAEMKLGAERGRQR